MGVSLRGKRGCLNKNSNVYVLQATWYIWYINFFCIPCLWQNSDYASLPLKTWLLDIQLIRYIYWFCISANLYSSGSMTLVYSSLLNFINHCEYIVIHRIMQVVIRAIQLPLFHSSLPRLTFAWVYQLMEQPETASNNGCCFVWMSEMA